MTCGVPVVASNTSSIPEVIRNAGILVHPQDVEAMSRAIRDAATNLSLRDELIQRGFERAREFTWAASANDTLRVIEQTANE
jgi:glycosyltransferase involved in cell wall biosynthesis